MYCSKADAIIIVFDIRDVRSFERAEELFHHMKAKFPFNRCLVLVGNKSDLSDEREVKY